MQSFRVLGGDIFGGELGLTRGTGGSAFDFYVDSVNGSDSNDGLSADTAFASLSALPTLTSGDRVGLARGSEWRESLDLSTLTNMTIAAYGDGKLPVVRGDDVIANATLTQDVTHTNTYTVQWTPPATGGAVNVFVDNVRLARATSAANCNTTPGSYYSNPSYTVGVAQTVYIHPPGSTNPATDGKLYEMTTRHLVVRTGDSSRVSNVRTMRQCSNNGSLELGKSCTVSGCVVQDGTKHGLLIGTGLVEDTYVIRGGDPWWSTWGGTTSTPVQGYATFVTGATLTFRNVVVINDPDDYDAFAPNYLSAFHAHGQSGNEYALVTYDNCQVYFCGGSAFPASDCDAVVIDRCLAYEALGLCGIAKAGMTITCTDSELWRQKAGVASLYARIFSGTLAATIVIERLRAVWPNNFLIWHSGSSDIDVTLTDSIIAIRNPTSFAIIDLALSSGTGNVNLTSLRNVFDTSATNNSAWRDYRVAATANLTLNSDYNVFRNSSDNFDLGGTVYTDVASYRAAFPTQDTHSYVGLPGFAGDPLNRDYSYAVGSQAVAIGAGQVDESTQHEGDYAALLTLAAAL